MTEAYKILSAIKTGLTLAGKDKDGELEWIGNESEWNNYEIMCNEYEHGNTFTNI